MFRSVCLVALAGFLTAAADLPQGAHPAAIPSAAAQDAAAGTRCEIRVYKRGGLTTVEGVVYASAPISGSYRLSVNGHSDNDQSGSFQAAPTGATSLGQLTVAPGNYVANMIVKWKDGSVLCAQHAGP